MNQSEREKTGIVLPNLNYESLIEGNLNFVVYPSLKEALCCEGANLVYTDRRTACAIDSYYQQWRDGGKRKPGYMDLWSSQGYLFRTQSDRLPQLIGYNDFATQEKICSFLGIQAKESLVIDTEDFYNSKDILIMVLEKFGRYNRQILGNHVEEDLEFILRVWDSIPKFRMVLNDGRIIYAGIKKYYLGAKNVGRLAVYQKLENKGIDFSVSHYPCFIESDFVTLYELVCQKGEDFDLVKIIGEIPSGFNLVNFFTEARLPWTAKFREVVFAALVNKHGQTIVINDILPGYIFLEKQGWFRKGTVGRRGFCVDLDSNWPRKLPDFEAFSNLVEDLRSYYRALRVGSVAFNAYRQGNDIKPFWFNYLQLYKGDTHRLNNTTFLDKVSDFLSSE